MRPRLNVLIVLAFVLAFQVSVAQQPRRFAPGELLVTGMKVGDVGRPSAIPAKVKQVIDGKSMLVGIEDGRAGNGRYATWVMVKAPTAGITDGKVWQGVGGWKEITGHELLAVTGTTTYKTTSGGTRTVFILEGTDGTRHLLPSGAPGKTGAAVYDNFSEPLRDQLVKEWKGERDAIQQAIKGDEERLARAKTAKERQHVTRVIADYKTKLAQHEKNVPPYFTKERAQELKGKK